MHISINIGLKKFVEIQAHDFKDKEKLTIYAHLKKTIYAQLLSSSLR